VTEFMASPPGPRGRPESRSCPPSSTRSTRPVPQPQPDPLDAEPREGNDNLPIPGCGHRSPPDDKRAARKRHLHLIPTPGGKARQGLRGIPDGGRRHTPADRWPTGRAGLPPGTAGINPHLFPPGQVRPAPVGDGLDNRPRATGRYGPVPAPPEQGDGPGGGAAMGRAPRRGHGGACPRGTRHRRISAPCRQAA